MSVPRRVGLRAEKRSSGAGLRCGSGWGYPEAGKGSLGSPGRPGRLGREPRLRRWDRLRTVFRTDAARWPHCAAGPTWTRRRPPSVGRAAAEARQVPGAMRPARGCPGFLRRGSSEKCAAGVPIRRGSDSPPSPRITHTLTLISARRPANPSRDGSVRHAPEAHFSGRRTLRRGADVAPPPRERDSRAHYRDRIRHDVRHCGDRGATTL